MLSTTLVGAVAATSITFNVGLKPGLLTRIRNLPLDKPVARKAPRLSLVRRVTLTHGREWFRCELGPGDRTSNKWSRFR